MEKEHNKKSQEPSKAEYVRVRPGEVISSEEVRPGIVLDYGANGLVVAIETYSADGAG